MRYFAAFPVVAASLVALTTLSECANAQSNPYALDRLFLDPSDRTPLYKILTFNNETEVANYYGATSDEALLAQEFFAGYSGSSANMLITRYPDLPGRAHLYGSYIGGMTIQELQTVSGPISIYSDGLLYSGSVDLSKVGSFSAAATAVTKALDKILPPAATTTGSSIAPVSVSFTGSINTNVLTVAALQSGSIQIGSMISGLGIPPGAQVIAQLSGKPGGVGVYSLFLHGPSKIVGIIPTLPMTETYGVLTVGSAISGTVAVGEQVNDAAGAALSDTEIEANLSGSGTGSTWVVNRAQTVASEDMTMTGAPLTVRYNTVNGATVKTGYLVIQQNQFANYSTASLTYAQGNAAQLLGLTQSAHAFLSSPGLVVLPGSCAIGQSNCTSAAAFMNNLVAMDPDWSTFQTTYFPATAIPPGTPPALAAWAQSTDGQYTYLEDDFGQHPADRGFNESKRGATFGSKREAIFCASKRHGSRTFDLGHDPCRLRGPGLCPISA